MSMPSTKWRYVLVFVVAMALTAVLHWGWHTYSRSSSSSPPAENTEGPAVTVCLPPFCDEQKQQDDHADRDSQTGSRESSEAGLSDNTALQHLENSAPQISLDNLDAPSIANPTHRVCVTDALGEAGFQYAVMRAWQAAALKKGGFRPGLVVYTEADMAMEDLRAGLCQAAWLPGSAGVGLSVESLEAPGAITRREQVDVLAKVFAANQSSFSKQHLDGPEFTVSGVVFSGASYLLVRDNPDDLTPPGILAENKLATLSEADASIAGWSGAIAVPSDLLLVERQLDTGTVDVVIAPLSLIERLVNKQQPPESLAVVETPIRENIYYLLTENGAFSPSQRQWSREYLSSEIQGQVEENLLAQKKVKALLPVISSSSAEREAWEKQLAQWRNEGLQAGVYDHDVLELMRKVRCKLDRLRSEC